MYDILTKRIYIFIKYYSRIFLFYLGSPGDKDGFSGLKGTRWMYFREK
jgi:hypothetical protein